jgi:hypothetical protein
MKTFIYCSLAVIAVFTIFYLFGSFIALDFDFRNWDAAGRSVFGMFSLIIGTIFCVIVYDKNKKSN